VVPPRLWRLEPVTFLGRVVLDPTAIGYPVSVIRRTRSRTPDCVKVSFSLPLDLAPDAVSVVGDFNDWFPERDADGMVVNEWGEVNSRLDL